MREIRIFKNRLYQIIRNIIIIKVFDNKVKYKLYQKRYK